MSEDHGAGCAPDEASTGRRFVARGVRASILLALALLLPAVAGAARIDCRIDGVDDEEVLKNIQATLSIVRDRDREDLTPARIQQLHQRAPMEIRRAVEPFGYYRCEIEGTLTPRDGDKFDARYVDRARRARARSQCERDRDRRGKQAAAVSRPRRRRFPCTPATCSTSGCTRVQERLCIAAADSGYLERDFTASAIRLHREANIADVDLVFAPDRSTGSAR